MIGLDNHEVPAGKSHHEEDGVTEAVGRNCHELSGRLNADIGCGKGMYAGYFKGVVVGLDLNIAKLSVAKNKYDGVVRASATHIPFKSLAFDFALFSEVLEHMPRDPALQALKEVRRISRRCLLTTPNRNLLFSSFSRIVYGPD